MSSSVRLLSIEETIAAAAAACARANQAPFDPRRALDALSSTAIISLAVLAGQLDGICSAAARAEDAWRRANDREIEAPVAAEASADLIRQLSAAGYLPLPEQPEPEEAADGAR